MFSYLIKSSTSLIGATMFIGFLLFPFVGIVSRINHFSIFIFILYTLLLTMIMPVFANSALYNQKENSVVLALPIKKSVYYNTKHAFYLSVILFQFITMYSLGVLLSLLKGTDYAFMDLFINMIIVIIFVVSSYGFNALFSSFSTRLFDSILFVCAYFALPYIVLGSINAFISQITIFIRDNLPAYFNEIFFVFNPVVNIFNITKSFQIFFGYEYAVHLTFYDLFDIRIIMTLVLGIVFYMLSIKVFNSRKNEDVEGISKSRFTYPLFTNIVMILILINIFPSATITRVDTYIFPVVILFVSYCIAHWLQYKKVFFNKGMIIKYLLFTAFAVLFSFATISTKCYGLDKLTFFETADDKHVYDVSTSHEDSYYLNKISYTDLLVLKPEILKISEDSLNKSYEIKLRKFLVDIEEDDYKYSLGRIGISSKKLKCIKDFNSYDCMSDQYINFAYYENPVRLIELMKQMEKYQ